MLHGFYTVCDMDVCDIKQQLQYRCKAYIV